MAINWADLSQWALGTGGLATALLSAYSLRANKKKTESEAGVNVASKSKTEAEAAALSEETEQKREKFWSDKLLETEEKLERKIEECNEEIMWLRVLIENHVPWDWETQRLLIQNGIEHRKPPTLNYVGRKKRETPAALRKRTPQEEQDEQL